MNYGEEIMQQALLKAQLLPEKIAAQFKILGNEGKFEVKHGQESIRAHGFYNGDQITLTGQQRFMPNDYRLILGMESSLPALKDVQVILEHVWTSESTLQSNAKLVWNEHVHFAKLNGEKADLQSFLQLETGSAYESLDDLFIRLENVRESKKLSSSAVFRFKKEAVKLQTMFDNGKPKQGQMSIETPWDCIRQMNLGFLFLFGRQIQLDTFMNWNEQPMISANVTGHLLPSDVALEFTIVKQNNHHEAAKGGFSYKKSNSGDYSSSANLEYGDSHLNLGMELKEEPMLANAKVDLKTPLIITNAQMNFLFKENMIDLKSHLNVNDEKLLQVNLKSWFESMLAHRLDSKLFVAPHEISVKANNDRGRLINYEISLAKDSQMMSSLKLETKLRHDSEGNKKCLVNAGFVMDGQETSFKIEHESTDTEIKSLLQIQADKDVVEVWHESQWSHEQHLSTQVGLKSPYEYLTQALIKTSLQLDKTQVSGDAEAIFDDKTSAFKFDAQVSDDGNQYDFSASGHGFDSQDTSIEAQFKNVDWKNIFFSSSLIVDESQQPILLRLALNAPNCQDQSMSLELDMPGQPLIQFESGLKSDIQSLEHLQGKSNGTFLMSKLSNLHF